MEHTNNEKTMNMANVMKALESKGDEGCGTPSPADGSLLFSGSCAAVDCALRKLKKAYKSIIGNSTEIIDEMNASLAWQLGGCFSEDSTDLLRTEKFLKDACIVMSDIHAISEETEQSLRSMLEYLDKMRGICASLQKARRDYENGEQSLESDEFNLNDDDE